MLKKPSWPDNAKINQSGHLEIGGCDTVALAQEFGTPLYIMDEATIRQRCRQYRIALDKYCPGANLIYACKALCVAQVLKVVAGQGFGLDVSSAGEIYTAQKAGVNLSNVYFHSNNKPKSELKFALEAGVGKIVADNLQEVENLSEMAGLLNQDIQVLLRLNPGIEAHTHEYIKTATLDSKFGVPLAQLEEAIKITRAKKNLRLIGLHAHIGSQIFDLSPFVDEVSMLVDLARQYGLEEIDMGGGVGIPYLEESPIDFDNFASALGKVFKGAAPLRLVLEPGRSIVGTAGVTLYTVGVVKDIPGIRKYLFIDGGMSDNPRPVLYQARYAAALANRMTAPAQEKVTIAGRFCESGDILIKDIELPMAQVGDLLVVFCTGAYNFSMASNYNRVGRPAMVMLQDGQAKLIYKRESVEDLTRNDLI